MASVIDITPIESDKGQVSSWEQKGEKVGAPETSEEITRDELADYFMAELLKGDGEGNGDDEPSLGRGVTLDKGSSYNASIFDPERFDQNSFEWGAIYWINQIRDAVEEFEDGYVVPDEQFTEMLRPLKKAAKVYAEAHGKDKAWVKNTVLSVPNAFANAFDTLSDGEGVSKEHFLKVFTVEGVCALAEGDIDSVHELENYYYRKGIYSPKSGYEVGRFVVIIKDPPSEKYESERIKHIIAIYGEKDDDDPTLVFWNEKKSGIIERKASQCSKPFHKCDDAYDWWFVENGDGAREVKDNPKADEEKDFGFEIYKAKLSSIGITEDAEPDMADADFWAKHDKARHGGHFDPETMTCKLREKYEKGEKIENLKDEMDDIEGEDPDVGSSGNAGSGNVTPEEDAAYLEAVKRGDMETAEQMVREAAKGRGYEVFGLHGTKGEFTVFDKKRIGASNDEGWLGRGFYFWDKGNRTYAEQYANGGKVMEVMLSMKEPYLIDKAEMERIIDAAERHDVKMLEDFSNEVKANGYDSVIDGDGQMLVFEPNQIKSADPVTYDDAGNVIPLSRRFDDGDDIRGDVSGGGEDEKKGNGRSEKKSGGISRIFTGSAADYSKPSLLHVGTGEGSQVYGWGLYGSTERGVAEGYAKTAARDKRINQDENTFRAVKKALGDKTSDDALQAVYEAITGYNDWKEVKGWLKRNAEYDEEAGPLALAAFRRNESALKKVHEEFVAKEHLYEQTFFTDRAPGDESHLLKWYEPVSEDILYWINEELARQGIDARYLNKRADYKFEQGGKKEDKKDFIIPSGDPPSGSRVYIDMAYLLGSEQAASEFLSRAGIDGVKYPVDSYGVKGVKDGDEAGWNYVSFRDDNIRIDKKYVDGQKVFDYQELMAKKFPNVDALDVLRRISSKGSPKEMAAEFHRILGSGKIAEDSLNAITAPAIEAAFGIGQDSADDRMVEFRDLIAKKFPDKDATAIILELGKIGSAEEQESYLLRILKK